MIQLTKDKTIIAVLSVALVVVFIIAGFQAFQSAQLEKDMQKLKQNKTEAFYEKQFSAIQKRIKSGKPTGDAVGYTEWKTSEELANSFVVQSEGRFKKEWGLFLVKEANRHGIDPYIVFELLKVETGGSFDPQLKGPKTKYGRAYGMAQFMKNTAPWIAEMANLPYKDELLYDPYYSIQLSVVYLDFLYDEYGSWDKALTAYNRGMGGLEKYIQQHGHANSSYAKKIQSNAKQHKLVATAN